MTVTIRPAEKRDANTLGRMGAELARLHYSFDPQRFMLPDDVESGYRWWLMKEATNNSAVVLVAEVDGEVAGYCYGRLEERDWNALLDAHGGLHDIWVDERFRGHGAAKLLAQAMIDALGKLGAPRIVLKTSTKNEAAQKLFKGLGWRPTMIEMTRER